MTKPKRILLIISLIIAVIIITPFLSITYLYLKADMKQPNISVNKQEYIVKNMSGYYKCNNSLLRKNEYGLWEIYLEGNAKERGATLGAIAQDLMKYQEDVFINQIREIIPSDSYLSFLRYLLIAFNRNLGSFIPDEFREEIYSASVFCTNEYNKIGTPYERQLN